MVPADTTYKEWKNKYLKESIASPAKPAIIDTLERAVGAKPGTPLAIVDAVVGANPNYNLGYEYKINCQRCVQAYEFRRRGYDVIAKPAMGRGDIITWGSECFIPDKQTSISAFTLGMTESAVKRTLDASPNGARYAVYVQWKSSRSAHVFIAEKDSGIVRYLDPQSGATDVSNYFARGLQRRFGLFRMDDKPITTNINKIQSTVEVIS